ncbi:putative 1,4-dihydroxy-2-naphthoate octaprenyltransferase (ec 2.5.1.-) (dhna-octaprenyltransferase) [Halobacteriovorax marinus SJ]|uniref:1,4-dihydroxy-2-naphthoate octaprenyltransferase n=1 Tax=Halobacteriovorax marinus (strain ATCC BAA-682 / DSM 15412 / SJ) TaxID=862908 RepID=E1X1B0_HALMS|nr:1,4-dihydroxy-2-naphthoate polyprenyltransferase [Halobacteriovorax marinus]CBW26501.1 putative 1,4-dihydroxy-2-naphthoate octaprenyltransferase (ec 2.5.1.-) (dhna-octaprenyltransferase) [Halobacteriovorax marinus SJ]
MNNKLSAWIQASRPKTLPAACGPVILGSALAYEMGENFSPLIFILTLLAAVSMQIGTNLVNDYYDAVRGIDSEKRLGPTRVTQAGLIPAPVVKRGFILCFLFAVVVSIYLMYIGGSTIIIMGILCILAAYGYTGGPFPFSHYALGELFALIFFGPVAVWGTYYLQYKEFNLDIIILGLGPGLISAAIMSVNNLRDIESDSKTQKVTIATLVGEKFARAFTLSLVLLSTFIPYYAYLKLNLSWSILATITCYPFFLTWKQIAKAPIDSKLNLALANTGKYLFLYCAVFSLGALL